MLQVTWFVLTKQSAFFRVKYLLHYPKLCVPLRLLPGMTEVKKTSLMPTGLAAEPNPRVDMILSHIDRKALLLARHWTSLGHGFAVCHGDNWVELIQGVVSWPSVSTFLHFWVLESEIFKSCVQRQWSYKTRLKPLVSSYGRRGLVFESQQRIWMEFLHNLL